MFYRIGERISRSNALNNMESSGSKLIMNGPMVCELSVRGKNIYIENTRSLTTTFHGFFIGGGGGGGGFRLPVYYFHEGFKTCWSTFMKDSRHAGVLL